MLGALFAVLSAASFGISNVATRRGVIGSSASYGLYITVILGVPLFVVAAAVAGQLLNIFDLSTKALALLSSAGVLHFLVGRYCNFRAIDAIGVNRTQPIQMTNTLYSVGVAVAVLGEDLTVLMVLGITLIMFGPGVMLVRSKQPVPAPMVSSSTSTLAGPTVVGGATAEEHGGNTAIGAEVATLPNAAAAPRYGEGYLFGFISAAAYGTSPVMIRAALDDTGLGIAGGLVAYSAAAAVLVISLLIPGKIRELRGVSFSVMPYFLITTVSTFLAQMFRFAALAIAPVTVVTPLTRLGVVFTLILGYVFNRHLESFSPKVLLGIAISVLGAVLVALGIQ